MAGTYLKSVKIKNFKSIKNSQELPLAPLTLIFGPNSSGKSSIIQSILLMKQTISAGVLNEPLRLRGLRGMKDFGTMKEVSFYRREEDIELKFTTEKTKKKSKSKKKESTPEESTVSTIRFVFGFKGTNRDPLSPEYYVKELQYEEQTGKRFWSALLTSKNHMNDTYTLNVHHIKNLSVPLPKSAQKLDGANMEVEAKFNGIVPKIMPIHLEEKKNQHEQVLLMYLVSYEIQTKLSEIFQNTHYLGPVREYPSREQKLDQSVDELDHNGSNIHNILLLEQRRDKKVFDVNFDTDSRGNVIENGFNQVLGRWADKLALYNIKAEGKDTYVSIQLQLSAHNTQPVNLTDVGFGTSQVLPILVQSIRMNPGDLLICEQPEIHLHPNLEMVLGDFFLAMARTGRRFIIETHSKPLLDRIIRRIVEDQSATLKDLVKIYFCQKESSENKGSSITEIYIDPRYGINEWPKDFFDSEAEDAIKTTIASAKSRP